MTGSGSDDAGSVDGGSSIPPGNLDLAKMLQDARAAIGKGD